MWCRPFLWPGQEEAPVAGGGRGFGFLIGGNLSDGREDHHLPSNIIPLSRETTAQGEHASAAGRLGLRSKVLVVAMLVIGGHRH